MTVLPRTPQHRAPWGGRGRDPLRGDVPITGASGPLHRHRPDRGRPSAAPGPALMLAERYEQPGTETTAGLSSPGGPVPPATGTPAMPVATERCPSLPAVGRLCV